MNNFQIGKSEPNCKPEESNKDAKNVTKKESKKATKKVSKKNYKKTSKKELKSKVSKKSESKNKNDKNKNVSKKNDKILKLMISDVTRNRLRLLLVGACFLSIILWLLVITSVTYTFIYVMYKGELIERSALLYFLNFLCIVVAFVGTFFNSWLVFVSHEARLFDNFLKWRNSFLTLTKFFGVASTFIVPITIIMMKVFQIIIKKGFVKAIREKMNKYYFDGFEKKLFDELQYDYQCCGTKSHDDWAKLMNSSFKEDLKRLNIKDYPFSCCKIEHLKPCQNQFTSNPDIDSLNHLGCADVFSQWITSFLQIGIYTTFILLVIYIIIYAMLQYWRISKDNAILDNDEKKNSFGWIWPITNEKRKFKKYMKKYNKEKEKLLEQENQENRDKEKKRK